MQFASWFVAFACSFFAYVSIGQNIEVNSYEELKNILEDREAARKRVFINSDIEFSGTINIPRDISVDIYGDPNLSPTISSKIGYPLFHFEYHDQNNIFIAQNLQFAGPKYAFETKGNTTIALHNCKFRDFDTVINSSDRFSTYINNISVSNVNNFIEGPNHNWDELGEHYWQNSTIVAKKHVFKCNNSSGNRKIYVSNSVLSGLIDRAYIAIKAFNSVLAVKESSYTHDDSYAQSLRLSVNSQESIPWFEGNQELRFFDNSSGINLSRDSEFTGYKVKHSGHVYG